MEEMFARTGVARAETVGSLLRPAELLDARTQHDGGDLSPTDLRGIEDRAVLDAIDLQEAAGLDVITDGELRRTAGWAEAFLYLEGLESWSGPRSYPGNVRMRAAPVSNYAGATATVVHRVKPSEGQVLGWDYPFLKAHASQRTKYTTAAPSYYRRYWSDEVSVNAYPSCEAYLIDVGDWLRFTAGRLVAEGCSYIQLDAPNYGSLCDADNREFHKANNHDLERIVAFDAELDSSVFAGLSCTSALHVCRGNGPSSWHSSGGYGVIAEQLFGNLAVDVVLLEYDSDRAGDFAPLERIKRGTVAVLGLLSTKAAELEDLGLIEARIAEASAFKPLEELAVSTQCGFASAVNAAMSEDDQRRKLEAVVEVARRVWKGDQ
jgi:5-methyltetrahydropteroyltriglutamate--homocysteine methyltransferase